MAMDTRHDQHADRRDSPRVRLQIRLAVIYPQHESRPHQPIYHGRTHDICRSGLSMIAEDNVFHEGEVNVLLALPPEHAWASQKIITATAAMTYAIRSSKLNGFKIGMTFVEFKHNGRELLEAAIRLMLKEADIAGTRHPGTRSNGKRPGDSHPLGW